MSDDLPAARDAARLPDVRVSDAEREQAVQFLREHCTDGRLTLDEFSDRVGVVFGARTAGEIEMVTSDLPAIQSVPLTDQVETAQAATPATRRSRAVKWTVSLFSSSHQRGRWLIEGESSAAAFMGSCHLDLREAQVVGHEAVINAYAFMGGIHITVPEGIDVVLEGFSFMGGRHARVKDVPVIPGSPLIRIRAFAFMGGVHVRSRGPSLPRARRTRERNREAIRDRDRQRLERRFEKLEQKRRGGRYASAYVGPPSAPLTPPAPPPSAARMRGIEAVTADVRDEWSEVQARVAPEGTVTIMFSDIEGFTSLCERLGDYRANELLREHYRLVRDQLAQHGGFEVKVHGDGFMVAFSSASRALRCASAIQVAQRDWNREHPEEPLRVRMGLHTGEAIRDADDFLGTTVNLASRIASAARGDEILVSGLLRELCVSTGEFTFDGGTEVELRGISQPHRVYLLQHA